MAEHVQAALDQMVAPLRDLIDRNIFSEQEVKQIVARRRDSEYLLRRVAARKADFLRYIDAEKELEQLRKLRTARRKRDMQQQRPPDQEDEDGQEKISKKEEHIGDIHIVQHLHLLYVRALRKFRSDLSLHLQHADFCKEMSAWTRLGRVYAEALQVFPRQAGLWIESASQEFFGPTKSISNARILLQRGIRMNTTCEELWLEYFSLELHYAQTLRGRKQILQGKDGVDETTYKIAHIVYKNAIQAIPDSVPFRLRFLDTCRRFPLTEEVMGNIQSTLQRDFDSQPESWIARAMYAAERHANLELTKMEQTAAEDGDGGGSESEEDNDDDDDEDRPFKKQRRVDTDPVVVVLEEAIAKIPTDEMYLQSLRFARSYQTQLEAGESKEKARQQVSSFCGKLFEQAAGHTSPEFALEHADYLGNLLQSDEAISVLDNFCSSPKHANAAVYIRLAKLCGANAASILQRAVDRIPINNPDHMRVLLQLCGALLGDGKDVHTVFQRILLLAPGFPDLVAEDVDDVSFGMRSVADTFLPYLQFALQRSGTEGARKVYAAALFQSTQKVDQGNLEAIQAFVDKCIQVEELESEKEKTKTSKARLRRLYDKAIELFRDTSLEDVYREKRNERVIYR
jgi:U3 small nucleolar RNA-associated protein 6